MPESETITVRIVDDDGSIPWSYGSGAEAALRALRPGKVLVVPMTRINTRNRWTGRASAIGIRIQTRVQDNALYIRLNPNHNAWADPKQLPEVIKLVGEPVIEMASPGKLDRTGHDA